MKTTKEMTQEILIIGATQRLEELNKEREILLKIIEKRDLTKTKLKIKVQKKKKLHWTQTKEARKQQSERMKRYWKEKK